MRAGESAGGAAANLVEAGAIKALIDCMQRNSDNAKVLEAAMWTLCTLVEQECYAECFACSSAAESIIVAMRNHPCEAGVQEQALWCLYWLATKHPAIRSRVASLGASGLVSLAASNHPTAKSITDLVPTIHLCLSENKPFSSHQNADNCSWGSNPDGDSSGYISAAPPSMSVGVVFMTSSLVAEAAVGASV
jgi:hypothetical protein